MATPLIFMIVMLFISLSTILWFVYKIGGKSAAVGCLKGYVIGTSFVASLFLLYDLIDFLNT